MLKLEGKIALVTGASKGIGAEIAKKLAAAGAAVTVNYSTDRTGAEQTVTQIESAGGRAIAVQANVASSDDVRRMLDETKRAFGSLDILVNNAGVYRHTPLLEVTEEEFHREFNTNTLGPLLMIRESLSLFGPDGGSIINIGSGASQSYPREYSIYTATKSALDALTRVLAKELASRRIRVNSVNPGATLSDGTFAAGLYGCGSKFEEQLVAVTPLGRLGQPSDIAPVVAFLSSSDSAWLTGEIILASGGLR